MAAADEPVFNSLRGPRGEFVPDVTARPIWRLLARGMSVYLPDRRPDPTALRVVDPLAPQRTPRMRPPVFLNGASGFGLQLRVRVHGLEPDREIYVRGRDTQTFGIVIAGPAGAVGSRVVDAGRLLRYARRLLFEELHNASEPRSVPEAVHGLRTLEGVVLLDRAAGIGLCAEVDPVTRAPGCPLVVRFGDGSSESVRTYAVGAWLSGPPALPENGHRKAGAPA